MTGSQKLRQSLKDGRHMTFVGAHNPFIAKLIERAGFEGVYLSGAGLSNSMGVADTGIMQLDDFAYMGRNIARATALPVISDADTGFGDIEATVAAYINAGIAGLHIEDQLFPKRCGHLAGKEVVEAPEMAKSIRRAVKVRDRCDPSFVIIARTDARGAVNIEEEDQFDEAVRRGIVYQKAGADVIFPESLKTHDEFAKYRKSIDGVLLANMTEFGKTPYTTTDEFGKLGYQIVILPVSVFRYVAGSAWRGLERMRKDGYQKNLLGEMMSRGDINKILDYDPGAKQ